VPFAEPELAVKNIDFESWIQLTNSNQQRDFRRAVHMVLLAISQAPSLPNEIVLKGGILMALAHHGDRFTRDIDFSTSRTVAELPIDVVRNEIDSALSGVVGMSEYGLDCRIQSSELRPPDSNKNWPTLIIKVGYASFSDRRRHTRLLHGKSPDIVRVECSFNEVVSSVELLEVSPGTTVRAYGIVDLVSEKYRALIQQPIRNRYRRQDVYDINQLLNDAQVHSDEVKELVLRSLIEKSRSRRIIVNASTLQDDEVRRRAESDYKYLASEIAGPLPRFSESFERIKEYYANLPWSTLD